MKMTFRWFGDKDDSVTLDQIRQIPGVSGIMGCLPDIPAGEVWPQAEIAALKSEVEAHGLALEVIESVNVHESIKLGAPDRERYIDNYNACIKNLGEQGVKVIIYNFMPVFDWLRTDLAMRLPDGSTTMAFDAAQLAGLSPVDLVRHVTRGSGGFTLPGWEPERLNDLSALLSKYEAVDEEALFANLKYFLEGIIPTCEKYDVKMAIHPDDPAFRVFGLPRIVTGSDNLYRLVKLVDSPYNGLTLCTGSLGSNPQNDLPAMMRRFGEMGRVHCAHLRNMKHTAPGKFHETSHLSGDGSFDMYEIVKALYDSGFDGYIRPDHGRMIWGERGRPGYGLYDRALGVAYLNGLWEAVDKSEKRAVR